MRTLAGAVVAETGMAVVAINMSAKENSNAVTIAVFLFTCCGKFSFIMNRLDVSDVIKAEVFFASKCVHE
jgi:hypothetical protein